MRACPPEYLSQGIPFERIPASLEGTPLDFRYFLMPTHNRSDTAGEQQ